MNYKPQGALPSDIKAPQKEQLNVITTRSGKTLTWADQSPQSRLNDSETRLNELGGNRNSGKSHLNEPPTRFNEFRENDDSGSTRLNESLLVPTSFMDTNRIETRSDEPPFVQTSSEEVPKREIRSDEPPLIQTSSEEIPRKDVRSNDTTTRFNEVHYK